MSQTAVGIQGLQYPRIPADATIDQVDTLIIARDYKGNIIDQGTFQTDDGRVFQSVANYFTDASATPKVHVRGYGVSTQKQYILDRKILCNAPISWRGDGANQTSIKLKNAVNDNMFEYSNGSPPYLFINFEHIYLQGNKANQTAGSGIYLAGTFFDVMLFDVYIDGFKTNGFKQDVPFNTRIIGSVFEHCGSDGFLIGNGGTDISISHSKWLTNSGMGFNIGNTTGGVGALRMYGNYCQGNSLVGGTLTNVQNAMLFGNTFENNAGGGSANNLNLVNNCSNTKVIGNHFIGGANLNYAIAITHASSTGVKLLFNDITGTYAQANPISDAGTSSIIRWNGGFKTENSGTATIAAGTTSITVTHGLNYTPSIADILVVAQSAKNNAGWIWISNVTATQFTINVDVAPTTTGLNFTWKINRT